FVKNKIKLTEAENEKKIKEGDVFLLLSAMSRNIFRSRNMMGSSPWTPNLLDYSALNLSIINVYIKSKRVSNWTSTLFPLPFLSAIDHRTEWQSGYEKSSKWISLTINNTAVEPRTLSLRNTKSIRLLLKLTKPTTAIHLIVENFPADVLESKDTK
ncbi:7475_t:CDS:2, partial [Paraglomus brasilianum]